jgi:hypothetical protein
MRVSLGHYSQQDTYDYHEIAKNFPFCLEEGHGTNGNVVGDFFHTVVTGVLFGYPIELD